MLSGDTNVRLALLSSVVDCTTAATECALCGELLGLEQLEDGTCQECLIDIRHSTELMAGETSPFDGATTRPAACTVVTDCV